MQVHADSYQIAYNQLTKSREAYIDNGEEVRGIRVLRQIEVVMVNNVRDA